MEPGQSIDNPSQFVDLYHSLDVIDPLIPLNVRLDLRQYVSGWPPDGVKRATEVLDAVARKCCRLKRGNADLPGVFSIQYDTRVDPTEEFYCAGIRRAFGGRGSPAEIRDALRLAVLGGIKAAVTNPKTYAETNFGQDCNSFVANWLGVSPMIGIPAYVRGYRAAEFGTTPDLADCVDLFSGGLPPRQDASEVTAGDVIVTYGTTAHPTHHWRWAHVALVEYINVKQPRRIEGKAIVQDADLGIAEWGTKGDRLSHHSRATNLQIVSNILQWTPASKQDTSKALRADLAKERLPSKTLVGWIGREPPNAVTNPSGTNPAIRFFLDASRFNELPYRGCHVRGIYAGH